MIAAFALWGMAMVLLGFVYLRLSRHVLDPLALFCYSFFLWYGFRESVITLGVDRPYRDNLFLPSQTPSLLVATGISTVGFLMTFILAYILVTPVANSNVRILPVAWRTPSLERQIRLVAFLTGVAALISAYLLAHYGGISGVIRAGKVNSSLAGSFALRAFPAVGAVTAAALALAVWHDRAHNSRAVHVGLFAVTAALLNAGFVMLWGSRQALAVVLLILTAGRWLLGRRDEEELKSAPRVARPRTRVIRVLMVGVFIAMAITGLRVARDALIIGHASSTIQGQSTVRQISVATNSTFFDANLLATRDWPSSYPYRDGRDFLVGVEAMVPRALWRGKPTDVTTGSWFRQVYQPTTHNGWPLGALGDWYVNFGLLGVLVGGTISGALFAGMTATWWRAPWSPFNIAALMCIVVFVVPTGFDAMTPLNWVEWGLPLLFCARYLDAPVRARVSRRRVPGSLPSAS